MNPSRQVNCVHSPCRVDQKIGRILTPASEGVKDSGDRERSITFPSVRAERRARIFLVAREEFSLFPVGKSVLARHKPTRDTVTRIHEASRRIFLKCDLLFS